LEQFRKALQYRRSECRAPSDDAVFGVDNLYSKSSPPFAASEQSGRQRRVLYAKIVESGVDIVCVETTVTKVIADISMSLDGFVTGPEPDIEHGLGRGGEPLHAWAFDKGSEVDAEVLREAVEATGSVVMGRRLFDFVDGSHGWDDNVGYGAQHATLPPVLVVTHRAPDAVRLAPRFSFVTDGLSSAIIEARAAAGAKDVFVMGGAEVVRRCVELGLADELRIHLAPVVLGSGTPLFKDGPSRQLVQRSVRSSRQATHITYEVKSG
jgi:dihydrofolate reductase